MYEGQKHGLVAANKSWSHPNDC